MVIALLLRLFFIVREPMNTRHFAHSLSAPIVNDNCERVFLSGGGVGHAMFESYNYRCLRSLIALLAMSVKMCVWYRYWQMGAQTGSIELVIDVHRMRSPRAARERESERSIICSQNDIHI